MTFLYHIPLARRQDFQIALLLEKAVIGEIRGNKGIHVHLCENSASKQIPVGGSESGTAEHSVRSLVFLP